MQNIAKRFGGDFDYEHGMQPDLDTEVREVLRWLPPNASLPMGPLKWVEEGKGQKIVVAVGHHEGRERKEKVASLGGKQASGMKTCPRPASTACE